MSNSVTLWAANSAGFPVLRYLPEFAWILVHWVSDAIQPSHPLLPSSSPPSSVFLSIRVFSSDSALCISGQTIRASALIPPMNIQTTGWHWKLEFPNLRVLFKKVTLCARIHVSLCRSHFLCCLPFAFTSWCFYLKDKQKYQWKESVESLCVSDSLWPHRQQHAWLPCPSWTPKAYKLMAIESVMPSNHLILCHPLLLLPAIFPSIRVFSSESVLHIMWPKYWSFSFNISTSNEYSGLISYTVDWFDLLTSKGLLRVLSSTTVQKHQFFSAQLSF